MLVNHLPDQIPTLRVVSPVPVEVAVVAPFKRPPVHLLRILLAEEMRVQRVDSRSIINTQVSLFDNQ
jgi:hypothetical protein